METLEKQPENLTSGDNQEEDKRSLLQARRDLEFGQTVLPVKPEIINPDAPVQSIEQIKNPLPENRTTSNQENIADSGRSVSRYAPTDGRNNPAPVKF